MALFRGAKSRSSCRLLGPLGFLWELCALSRHPVPRRHYASGGKKKAFAGEEEAECRHEDGRYDLVQVARSLSEECMLNFASMAHRNRSDWQIVCRRTGLHTLTRSFPPSLCLFLSLPSSLFPSLSTPEANALAGLQTSRCQIGGPYSCWQRLRQWLGKEHV